MSHEKEMKAVSPLHKIIFLHVGGVGTVIFPVSGA